MSVPVVAALKLPKFSSRAVNESVGGCGSRWDGWSERDGSQWESVGAMGLGAVGLGAVGGNVRL
jgi:hypothetical protein